VTNREEICGTAVVEGGLKGAGDFKEIRRASTDFRHLHWNYTRTVAERCYGGAITEKSDKN